METIHWDLIRKLEGHNRDKRSLDVRRWCVPNLPSHRQEVCVVQLNKVHEGCPLKSRSDSVISPCLSFQLERRGTNPLVHTRAT